MKIGLETVCLLLPYEILTSIFETYAFLNDLSRVKYG